jgi:1-acyl-sn-glycerol-3-phosphate acyltransferase
VIACIPRPLYFLGKRYTFGPRLTAAFLERVAGQIPISDTGSNEASLNAAIATVEAGRVLALAPEGTRSPDGRIRRGHTGVAMIAFATGRPVIPVAVGGTFAAWPRTKRLPRLLARTAVLVGEPIRVQRDTDAATDPRRCRALTDDVMAAIAELLGQPYDAARLGAAKQDGGVVARNAAPD